MTEWFNQRYVSRNEHQQVVDYYRKQVARLYCELCEMRTQVDAQNIDAMFEIGRRKAEHELRKLRPSDNVIRLDFRRKS
jgi:hypothetical protein